MDLLQATKTPVPVPFGGDTLPVRQLELREWAAITAWLTANRPSPLVLAGRAIDDAARLGTPLSRSTRDHVLDRAYDEARRWPPPAGTRAWLREICTADGGEAQFYQAVFRAGGTELGLDQVVRLVAAATEHEVNEVVRLAYFGDPPDPKPETPGSTTGPETTERASTTTATVNGPRSSTS